MCHSNAKWCLLLGDGFGDNNADPLLWCIIIWYRLKLGDERAHCVTHYPLVHYHASTDGVWLISATVWAKWLGKDLIIFISANRDDFMSLYICASIVQAVDKTTTNGVHSKFQRTAATHDAFSRIGCCPSPTISAICRHL